MLMAVMCFIVGSLIVIEWDDAVTVIVSIAELAEHQVVAVRTR